MGTIAYPTWTDVCYTSTTNGYKFPEAFVEELAGKFPDWPALHDALKRSDQVVWGLLRKYQEKLSEFTTEQIIEAAEADNLQDLVERARQSIETAKYIKALRPRHFPKEVEKERRKAEQFDQEFAAGQVFL